MGVVLESGWLASCLVRLGLLVEATGVELLIGGGFFALGRLGLEALVTCLLLFLLLWEGLAVTSSNTSQSDGSSCGDGDRGRG